MVEHITGDVINTFSSFKSVMV